MKRRGAKDLNINYLLKRKELTKEQKEEIRENFNILVGKNKSESIHVKDIKIGLMSLGFFLNEEELEIILKKYRERKQEYIAFNEFQNIVILRIV
jgi:Ca2+-binding EF-hand superfamily protein